MHPTTSASSATRCATQPRLLAATAAAPAPAVNTGGFSLNKSRVRSNNSRNRSGWRYRTLLALGCRLIRFHSDLCLRFVRAYDTIGKAFACGEGGDRGEFLAFMVWYENMANFSIISYLPTLYSGYLVVSGVHPTTTVRWVHIQ